MYEVCGRRITSFAHGYELLQMAVMLHFVDGLLDLPAVSCAPKSNFIIMEPGLQTSADKMPFPFRLNDKTNIFSQASTQQLLPQFRVHTSIYVV